MKHVLLVDGMSLLFRGYYATAYRGYIRKTEEGVPVNGVHWFIRYMVQVLMKWQPTHVVCCWDVGKQTFRNELFQDYKANRDAPPEALIPQFDLIKKVTQALGMTNCGLTNYEADDIAGTLAHRYQSEATVTILTSDKDYLQLVDEHVRVAIMKKGFNNFAVYDNDSLYNEYGISAEQMIELKALMGDPSDNYPGVKGVGEKTALKLLHEYGDTENLWRNIAALKPTMQKKLTAGWEHVEIGKRLATILRDVPVTLELDEVVWKPDHDRVKAGLVSVEASGFSGEFESLMKGRIISDEATESPAG